VLEKPSVGWSHSTAGPLTLPLHRHHNYPIGPIAPLANITPPGRPFAAD